MLPTTTSPVLIPIRIRKGVPARSRNSGCRSRSFCWQRTAARQARKA